MNAYEYMQDRLTQYAGLVGGIEAHIGFVERDVASAEESVQRIREMLKAFDANRRSTDVEAKPEESQ